MTAASPALLLASSSPRRRDLLLQLGITPDKIHAPDIDETPGRAEHSRAYTVRMAREKAEAARDVFPGAIILAADTSVVCGRMILPKAEDEATARWCLRRLSGRRHIVCSAIAVIDAAGVLREKMSQSKVAFKRLDDTEIEAYMAGGEWQGKAGGYAIQGQAAGMIRWTQGSFTGIVGLPLFETRALLRTAGYHVA
jgi:septum formation protein